MTVHSRKLAVPAELPAIVARSSGGWKELSRLLEEYRGKNHLVLMHGTPDPDAISSALALDTLGQLYDIETTILAFSTVSHHENRTLVKRLGIQIVPYDSSYELSRHDIYSIVDSQKFETPITAKLGELAVEFLAFIDHHKCDPSTLPPAKFVDIREEAGSTAAILCDYLRQALPKGLEPDVPAHVRLATALMHGIRSDTQKFLTATSLEYEGAALLADAVDTQIIEVVERKVLTSSMLGILENALVNRKIHDNFIFSDVGFVRSVDRDGIPQAADLLITREGTDTVLVFGIVDEKTIDGSFRTRSEMINPDEFLKGFLGISPESGKYYGGGNVKDKGGFQIPLGFLSMYDDKNQVYQMAREVIESSFLEYIGKTAGED